MKTQLKGERFVLEVVPEITDRELKQQIKECLTWDNELTCRTTAVELVAEDGQMLLNDETIADVGLSPDSDVRVIFKENSVTCSHTGELTALDHQIDLEPLIALEIPENVTELFLVLS